MYETSNHTATKEKLLFERLRSDPAASTPIQFYAGLQTIRLAEPLGAGGGQCKSPEHQRHWEMSHRGMCLQGLGAIPFISKVGRCSSAQAGYYRVSVRLYTLSVFEDLETLKHCIG